MRHLKQPRGAGTGWVFRMTTPPTLVGRLNPMTGQPFGKEIMKGLGTRSLAEARVQRDIFLGEIRKLEASLERDGKFSLADAEAWREAIVTQEAKGAEDEPSVRSLLLDRLESEESKPASKRAPKVKLERFAKVALGTGYPLDRSFEEYLAERAPGNAQGRGGSVRLNSFRVIAKWISALFTPPPGLASAG